MKATLTTARQAFEEQIAAFALRLELVGTERYDDLRAQEHYRAFAVAGAMKADLLADLREAVRVAIVDGGTIQQFRKDFQQIVERHGWHGWTGEGTRLGEAWRTRVIYQTNARKSYSAGRYAQLTDPTVTAVLPYWRWRHSGLARDPRPEHVAWDGMTLHHTHPFWKTYFPPRIPPDYGCGCSVEAVREPQADARTTPPADWEKALDPGAGAPPADVVEDILAFIRQKRANLPPELARPLGEMVDSYQIGSRGPLRPDDGSAPVMGRRPGLLDLPPVPITELTGVEWGEGLTREQLMQLAAAALRELQRGPGLVNLDTGWELVVNQKSRKKIGDNEAQSRESLLAVAALAELVRNAVLVENHADKAHHNEFVAAISRLYVPVRIASKLYRVKLTVKALQQGGDVRKLLHALVAVEIGNAPLGTLPNSSDVEVGTAQPTTGRTLSIAELLAGATLADGKPIMRE